MKTPRMTDRLQSILQRRVGAEYENSRHDEYLELIKTCPPIDPNMIGHLKKLFSNKKDIKPTHPQLAQLLQIQYGIDLIIEYIEDRWNQQTLRVRREREI